MADLPDKEKAFFEWYNEVLELSNLTDKRYPIKGVNVWTPFGFRAIALMDRLIRGVIEPLGYEEVSFPTLIPETEFQKEKEHIKGFDEQVYWVTHGGSTKLDVKLALRPTSETAMYPMFALWVRSHRDLPLRVFQIVTVFRYETKATRPLMRVREIHFFEGHTVQATEGDAEGQVRADISSFESACQRLCLPHLIDRRPEWDKFAGAHYSTAFDLPLGGSKTLQIGSVHYYKDNFAKAYGISYEEKDGTRKIPYQTTYGISERLLGAVVAVHGDGKGLVWPSAIAPVQVVVIPIPKEGGMERLLPEVQGALKVLLAEGIRTVIDSSEDRPGAKFYGWELKGVPLRLEIGPREVREATFSAVTRLGERSKIPQTDLVSGVRDALANFDKALLKNAEDSFQRTLKVVKERTALDTGSVNIMGWCLAEACGKELEKVGDISLLGTLENLDVVGGLESAPPSCVFCGRKDGARWAVAARPL